MGAAWNTEDLVFYSSRPWLRGGSLAYPSRGLQGREPVEAGSQMRAPLQGSKKVHVGDQSTEVVTGWLQGLGQAGKSKGSD